MPDVAARFHTPAAPDSVWLIVAQRVNGTPEADATRPGSVAAVSPGVASLARGRMTQTRSMSPLRRTSRRRSSATSRRLRGAPDVPRRVREISHKTGPFANLVAEFRKYEGARKTTVQDLKSSASRDQYETVGVTIHPQARVSSGHTRLNV
jgi:hypothetical protein